MNHNKYTKITEFRLFGIRIWEKAEISNETDYDEEEIINVSIRPDYFKAEFE